MHTLASTEAVSEAVLVFLCPSWSVVVQDDLDRAHSGSLTVETELSTPFVAPFTSAQPRLPSLPRAFEQAFMMASSANEPIRAMQQGADALKTPTARHYVFPELEPWPHQSCIPCRLQKTNFSTWRRHLMEPAHLQELSVREQLTRSYAYPSSEPIQIYYGLKQPLPVQSLLALLALPKDWTDTLQSGNADREWGDAAVCFSYIMFKIEDHIKATSKEPAADWLALLSFLLVELKLHAHHFYSPPLHPNERW